MRDNEAEVLVVGAGPTGLLMAILLGEAGINVRIIDCEERTTARSYACVLHSSNLELFDRLGMAPALLERGRRLHTIAFYDGAKRRAELKLAELGGAYPFLLVVAQSDLEETLEERFRKTSGIKV